MVMKGEQVINMHSHLGLPGNTSRMGQELGTAIFYYTCKLPRSS